MRSTELLSDFGRVSAGQEERRAPGLLDLNVAQASIDSPQGALSKGIPLRIRMLKDYGKPTTDEKPVGKSDVSVDNTLTTQNFIKTRLVGLLIRRGSVLVRAKFTSDHNKVLIQNTFSPMAMQNGTDNPIINASIDRNGSLETNVFLAETPANKYQFKTPQFSMGGTVFHNGAVYKFSIQDMPWYIQAKLPSPTERTVYADVELVTNSLRLPGVTTDSGLGASRSGSLFLRAQGFFSGFAQFTEEEKFSVNLRSQMRHQGGKLVVPTDVDVLDIHD